MYAWKALALSLCAHCLCTAFLQGQLVINEVMSSNVHTVADEDQEFEDWIELHNTGSSAVDLAGYGLTDNPSQPFKWTFAPTVIPPGGYLLVWASGHDRQKGSRRTGLLREVYHNIPGTTVSALRDSPKFQGPPDETGLLPDLFDAPQNVGNDYGQRISGWLAVPVSGNYRFSIAADDLSELWLSTDENPQNAVRIVRTTGWAESRTWTRSDQHSTDILLETGRRYYMEALMKEGGGNDHLTVRMRKPDGTFEEPMSARHFVSALSQAHTNFSISAGGETLQLTAPGGAVVDTAPAVALGRDVSYGRSLSNPSVWRYYRKATPGAANTTQEYTEMVQQAPVFSRSGGFYQDAFPLELTTSPGFTVLYTLDGSVPDPDHIGGKTYSYKNQYPRNVGNPVGPFLTGSFATQVYGAPLTIQNRASEANKLAERSTTFDANPNSYKPNVPVFKGTVVRSRLVKDGAVPGPVVTHSYFVAPNATTRYGLPVLSLSMDEDTLFDHFKGIYTAGVDFEEWRATSTADANGESPANYQRRGDNAEFPVHLEWFDPGQGRSFAQNLGYRINGGWSRTASQKSLRLYAKSGYDDQDWMNHPLIPGLTDHTGAPLESFRRLVLRNGGNDGGQTRLRDEFIQELIKPLGLDQQGYRPVIHFINGEYWGHINLRERVDRFFIGSHHGINPDDVVILSNDAELSEGTQGDREHYLNLRNYIRDHSMADPAHYAAAEAKMDMRNFLLYNVAQIYANNRDWPHNNNDYWRSKVSGNSTSADGRWRWIVYDTDFGFGLSGDHTTNTLTHALGTAWSRVMLTKLLENPGFRKDFINAFADHMATTFRPERANVLADQMAAVIAPYMPEHNQRWRNQGSNISVNGIKTFGQNRPASMRQHLISHFGLAGTAPVTLDVGGTKGGHFVINTLELNAQTPGIGNPGNPFPWTATYFQGVPVTVTAVAEEGHRFIGWQGRPEHESATIELDPTGGIQLVALFEEAPVSEPPRVLHRWNFEAGSITGPVETIGGGQLSVAPAADTETLINPVAEGFADSHLRINLPIGATLHLALPTLHYEKIALEYLTRRSGSGAGSQTLSYTLDGEAWTSLQTYSVASANPQLIQFDFSGIAGSSNNPNFAVRITFDQGTGGAVGNNRFDDIILRGTVMEGANLPPAVVAEGLPPANFSVSAKPGYVSLNAGAMFEDREGDALAFTVESEREDLLEARIAGDRIDLQGLAAGECDVTVRAEDGNNSPVEARFRVLIHPSPYALLQGTYQFGHWPSTAPAMTYPSHMIFLQGNTDDSLLSAELNRAYGIPAAESASGALFPYAASSGTRINGLGDSGMSFINTGRGRDLGAAVLSLDTRGVAGGQISFTAGTVNPNLRIYALRLQYRLGHQGPFQDVLDASSQPVEYLRETAGHAVAFGPIDLPQPALGQEEVQFAWRYHHVGVTSGARAELRLDDVSVSRTLSGFAGWREAQFPDPEELEDATISGPQADPMGLGVGNLIRYALDIESREDLDERLPALAMNESSPAVFRFPFDGEKPGIAYQVEASPDLEHWDEVIFDSRIAPSPVPVEGWLEVTDAAIPERRFYRLKILMTGE